MANVSGNCCRSLLAAIVGLATLHAEPVSVKHVEGEVHGFVALRSMDGHTIADGDSIQTVRAGEVINRLVFHFRDGSLHDETAVFSQRAEFRLLRYRLIQKGPAFKTATDLTVECATGQVTVNYTEHGEQKTVSEKMDLPADLANGMVPTLLKSLAADAAPLKVAMVVTTPKPRLVKLEISLAGEDSFSTGATRRKARHYVVKVELGGIVGVVAPIVGKQPPDTHVWILGGEAPEFVKSEGPLGDGLPVWRIEMVSPIFPRTPK